MSSTRFGAIWTVQMSLIVGQTSWKKGLFAKLQQIQGTRTDALAKACTTTKPVVLSLINGV
jgi:hypothetical protein